MSFEVEVERKLGNRRITAVFRSGQGITALFGPSGAGKTSILNMVAGLLRPDAGSIAVDGAALFGPGIDVPAARRGCGYVFQEGRLFPHLRVAANLAYGQRSAVNRARSDEWNETIAFLGLDGLLDRWPRSLSGGEARRVAIGRALLSRPKFLLMDEPLASLDRARREQIIEVVERIRDELRLPILYVSHDRCEVDRLAATVVEVPF